jgi:hypothetical protein
MNVLLATLLEFLDLNKDFVTGNADEVEVSESKKRFFQALIDVIDYRVQIAMEERRRALSQERIAVADSINSSIKSTASTIKSITALNSAPPPPTTANPEDMQKWLEAYDKWYNTKRKDGISIG